MTKTEWKRQILAILANDVRDLIVDTDIEIKEADLDRIDAAKEELIAEFGRRSALAGT